ncbi:MAG: M81 family metallopeptidase [Acidobacteria bacterium]|nr:M81 family metallopeptidase [Acidobacteriota bacterium]
MAVMGLFSSSLAFAAVVAVGGFMHESNSFNPSKTTLADYGIEEPAAGNDVLQRWERSSTEVAGYLQGAREAGFTVHPTLLANATPKGPLTDECYNTIFNRLLAKLKSGPKLDGLLLALHGAMVVESYPHGDEETVRRLRKHFGPDFPIVVTHDYHANVSPEIVRLATALITYKQNPHLDTKDRGIQAARLMGRILRGEVKPVQAVAHPPMLFNIIFQNTYAEPYKLVTDETISLEKTNPKILAASAPGGYQYADVPYVGPAGIVTTDNDPALAQREAQRLADQLWGLRERIRLNVPDAARAVREAMAADKFPVALFDTGDNIGGGSAGDSTFLLDELMKQKATGWVVVIADPVAVKAAAGAGIGGAFDMAVGGKTDNMHGKPVRVRGRVKSLHDGNYIETAVRHGGGRYHGLGLAAVIEADGSTRDMPNLLLVTTRRSSPNSLHQLISVGIYPERMRILTAKGTIAPRAAYEPVAAQIVPVDTPGATAINPARFTFRRVRDQNLLGLK